MGTLNSDQSPFGQFLNDVILPLTRHFSFLLKSIKTLLNALLEFIPVTGQEKGHMRRQQALRQRLRRPQALL